MTTSPLNAAASELAAAAAAAKDFADDNPFNPWFPLAATIELVAAGLNPLPRSAPGARGSASGHLLEAARLLNSLPPNVAPADLDFWKAHVADLHTNAVFLEAATAAGPRSQP